MTLPFLSIIIPAKNEEYYLPQCLDSINKMDYPKERFEVILVDNGSSDRTREIGVEYGAKVFREDRLTVAGLRNFGAAKAAGQVLAFVDADCSVAPGWAKCAEKYYGESDISAWGAPPLPPPKATWVQKTWFLVRKKKNPVEEVDWLESMNLFVRRESYRRIGGFNENLITCEDVDFCYRLRKLGKIISDRCIEVIHFGEAATLKHFIHKEIWRGTGNFHGILSHGLSLKEVPSLAVPVYFGFILPLVALWAIQSFNLTVFLVFIGLSLAPSILAVARMLNKLESIKDLVPLAALLNVYFTARTYSVYKSLVAKRSNVNPV